MIARLQAKTQRTHGYSEEWNEIGILSAQYNDDSKKATKTIQTTKTLTTNKVSEVKVLMIGLTGKGILLKGHRLKLLTGEGSNCWATT